MKNRSSNEIKFLITKLRESIQDVVDDDTKFDNDFYLYKWLKHYKMDVDTTEHKIRKSVEWRREVNLEELTEGDWAFYAPGLEKEIPIFFDGLSKSGQPISATIGDSIDARELVQKYGKDSLVRYFYQFSGKLEKLLLDHYKEGPTSSLDNFGRRNSSSSSCYGEDQDCSSKSNYYSMWDAASTIQIVSYRNFSMRNMMCVDAVQAFIEGAKAGLTYFPALTNSLYIVDLNRFSSLVFKVIKPIIASHSFKVEVFDNDKSTWSKVLLEQIDANQLHPFFGGTQIVSRK